MSSSAKRIRPATTEGKLERHVKTRFGMSLRDFIRQKSEVQGFYDSEIGDLLNVSPDWIGHYRGKIGIRRGNRFPTGFENIYGKDALERFKKIIEDPDSSLVDVARHFAFTREYARQVYQRIYGYPYTKTLKMKRELKKRSKGKRKVGKLWKAADKMKAKGLDFEVANLKRKLLVSKSGHRIAVRNCSRPYVTGENCYFRFASRPPDDIDFFICVCKDKYEDIYFVIPSNEMPERLNISLIPHATLDQSKYTKFREAWHLLELGR